MKKEDLYKEIGLLDEDIVEEAEEVKQKKHFNRAFAKFGAVAAGLAILVAVGIPILKKNPVQQGPDTSITRTDKPLNNIESKKPVTKEPAQDEHNLAALTGGVTAKYVEEVPGGEVSYDLAELSLEEIFGNSKNNYFEKIIVQGSVTKIKNIELDFKGFKNYRAIATIQVEKVFKGNVSAGDVVRILLPCGIGNGVWMEDCGVISCIREGMKGIFMPYVYDDKATIEMRGVTLHLKELVEYGLGDGERFAFLLKDGELVYEKQYTYTGLKGAKTLEEVGAYIEKMLKKYKAE